MTLGTSTQAYGEPSYWDKRYSKDPAPFDWYQKYPALAPLFQLYLRHHHRILLVGCGNSTLGDDMVKDGYQDVVNIDISSVVIEAMRKKYKDCPQLIFTRMDVRDMNAFDSGSFDAVIDKGTLDSLMCGSNASQNANKMLEEIGSLNNYQDPQEWRNICAGKFGSQTQESQKWNLTVPIPQDEDSTSINAILGKNSDVHYIYVGIKDESLRLEPKESSLNIDKEEA
ncbi:hypothetical protein H6P81_004421 [Aristolochia fimbriata]|uniref:Methyltransferase domain-containing protein n=1 Tax=Aristolochia fimbriata TaxID=158543 RepID=A0AAV7FG19_ARIFI|nr:hypothetical protein H6P81_004421 [Aristolochia fimbriata]